jgi:hypothetical protein
MLTQIIKQASATGITASSVATVKIPTGGTHYALILAPKAAAGTAVSVANMKTAIGNMVLKHNGEQVMEGTATFFLDLQKYYGDSYGAGNVAGVIMIPFAPTHFTNFVERQVFAVGTRNIQTLTLDMNILDTTNMATIDVYSELTPESRPRGKYLRIKKFSRTFGATGEHEVADLPLEGATVGYKALHITQGSGTFTSATVKIANFSFFDNVLTYINTAILAACCRTTQSGYFHIDFAKNNDITSLVPMGGVQDFRVLPNFATQPDNYTIYAEQYADLDKDNAVVVAS